VGVGLEHQALQGLRPVMIPYLAPLQAQVVAVLGVTQTHLMLLLVLVVMVVQAAVALGRSQ